ncbi:DUF3854 domain-containing protein [Microcoleus sp. FACHB-1515]|uniref:plasmid replication protein, CyRepA1 family n=1 Tax=Cyanophyceae TaxID=3028117 RepID=UPI001682E11E|nr:plasmid replication protein, CyRepA1 family [Microcoleus sp. FACHB-1515]MBD2088339.1 DUF3854 domain-containing protein [Microcoleus sp. FACHB-1515]
MSIVLRKPPAPAALPFEQRIEQEFIVGSGIALDLYAATIDFLEDTGRWEVHEALGLDVRPQWQTRKPHDFGVLACLRNEDDTLWQGKPERPIVNAKGKPQKYQSVAGAGSRAFLPHIPASIRRKIAERYQVEVPLVGSFWEWLAQHPEIPILFTEGGKKALSLLGLGYVAIALYGVNGGYLKCKVTGDRSLIPDVARFALTGRPITLAFDQDTDSKTQARVNVALWRFGGLLQAAGCEVAIARWDGAQGKGVDDLIVHQGAAAFDRLYQDALPLQHWQLWQRLEQRLTHPAALRIHQADLAKLEIAHLPQSGIIGIAAAKGTGKTKLIASTIKLSESVLSAGHRIALMRNLCERLGLRYRGDLDRAGGRFIDESGYALRIGFCVDALMAIDPEQFKNCDLIIDEVVQVLRHLLTSSTCNKDGMRPLLLARFAALVRSARRVIVADADLDNATLHYLQQLRGEGDNSVFLIRNDYQPQGYAVRYVESRDSSPAIASLLTDVGKLAPGKVLFVSTDSLRKSQHLANLIEKAYPSKCILVLNSHTSNGSAEQAFIKTPDAELHHYDVVIASPTLGTGASIEAQGVIDRVYGLFSGGSSTDADMAQALGRVREPVPRIVWCAKRGSNFSKVSRSTSSLELKSQLQQKTSIAASLVKLSLSDAASDAIDAFDWKGDAHLNLWCHFAAEQNRSMLNLRDALLVRLRQEGHIVEVESAEPDAAMKLRLKATSAELKQFEAEAKANADELTYAEIKLLEAKESPTPAEKQAIDNFHIRDFYCLDSLTVEDVTNDKDGRYRGELLNLEAALFPDTALDRTARALEKQASWNQGLCPWDLPDTALRQAIRVKLGLLKYIDADRTWTKYDLAADADRARQMAGQIKTVLHLTITPKMSDVQIIHQLLSQMGLKVSFGWSRAIAGHEGEKLRVYRLDASRYEQAIGILHRRQERRETQQPQTEDEGGSPMPSISTPHTEDPEPPEAPTQEKWASEADLADVRVWLAAAKADPSDESVQQLLSLVPPDVIARAIG